MRAFPTIACFVAALAMAATVANHVVAQEPLPELTATFTTLRITDAQGIERIRLHATRDGGSIQLLDDRGRTTITADSVTVSRDAIRTEVTATALRIYDSHGACRVEVALDGGFGAHVELKDHDEQRLAQLSAGPDFGGLELGPAATRIRARAGTSPRAFLQLLDMNEVGDAKVGVELSLKDAPEVRIDGFPVR